MKLDSAREPFTSRQAVSFQQPTSESAVLVPLLMALITGSALALAYLWAWWEAPTWLPLPVECAAPSFMLGFASVWAWRLARHDIVTRVEEIARLDLNQDGNIGKPESFASEITVNLTRGERLARFRLPCPSLETLVEVASSMLAGSTLPDSEWSGLSRGKPFSEGGLRKFKATLVEQGLARWIDQDNLRLGLRLTEDGVDYMRSVMDDYNADDDSPTLPIVE